jgi:hypothetical protein
MHWRGPGLRTGTKAIAYFEKGWKSRGLARQGICIIFSTQAGFLWLWLKQVKQWRY